MQQEDLGPANISVFTCSRLYGLQREAAEGLRYHASIPFFSHGVQMGIMNVARGDWRPLPQRDLVLLSTIASQLGIAVDRDRLLALRAERAIRQERERVAADLHDTLVQGLAGISLQLESADLVFAERPAVARKHVQAALRLARSTIVETRRAVEDLGPAALDEQSLSEALADLVDGFARDHGIAADHRVSRVRGPVPADAGRALHRAVSEGLHNVVKHSGATHVELVLRRRRGRLLAVLQDNGRGFDPGRVSGSLHGYGLDSMRRRVRMLGGSFRLSTALGRGTRVEISLPLRPE
jgi:signal transduction histidine kinase